MDFSKINPGAFKHSAPIQIRFVDIDLAGHVNNATILSYFETARVEFLNEMIEKENDWQSNGLVIAHSEIDYIQPVYLQDKIKVYSRVLKMGTKSFTIENLLVKMEEGKEIFASYATFVIVCLDYRKKETKEIPSEWRAKFQSFL